MRYAISDIHGCYKTFTTLLNKLVDPTKIYIIGDCIDRGRDSKKIIDFIMKRSDITVVEGNHENMFKNAILKPRMCAQFWLKYGGVETMRSFGYKSIDGLRNIPQKYIKWLSSLKPIIHLRDYILVHAGIDFSKEEPFALTEKNINTLLFDYGQPVDFKKSGKRKLIVGHMPRRIHEIKESIRTTKIEIDGGCIFESFRNLVAFNMDTNDLIIQNKID